MLYLSLLPKRLALVGVPLLLGALLTVACANDVSPTAASLYRGDPASASSSHVASLVVSPTTVTLTVGDSITINATARDRRGRIIKSSSVTWESSSLSIASVSSNGLITGIGPGSATITARSGNESASVAVTVRAPAPPASVASVTLNPTSASISVGTNATFNVTLRDSAGNELTERSVAWASGNTAVASVVNGVATAISAGTTSITATSEGRSASAALTVTATTTPPPAGITFSSDWSTALGSSVAALQDGGKWNTAYCQQAANVLSVVAGSTVGWTKTPNVLRLQQLGSTQCGTLEKLNAVPLSTSHWGRFYFRNDEIGTQHNHVVTYNPGVGTPIQTALWNRWGAPDGVSIFMRTYYTSAGGGMSYPTNLWSIGTAGVVGRDRLPNGVWYRYEWHMEYVTSTTYRIWPRIYNMAGTLLYDATRFYQNDYPQSGTHSLSTWYSAGNTFGFSDVTLAQRFGLGNEGPGGSSNTGGYWYHADVALSTSGWIGH